MELGFKEIMEVFTKHGIMGVLGIILTLGLYKLINSEWLGNKLSKVHDLTIDLVEGVCSSHFYNSENNLLKVYSILNILMTILESTISNSENICNSINGALKTMPPFDGFKEPK